MWECQRAPEHLHIEEPMIRMHWVLPEPCKTCGNEDVYKYEVRATPMFFSGVFKHWKCDICQTVNTFYPTRHGWIRYEPENKTNKNKQQKKVSTRKTV